jgi:hypothetical protein
VWQVVIRLKGAPHHSALKRRPAAVLNNHERIANKIACYRTRKDSNFKPPSVFATMFQIEKCWPTGRALDLATNLSQQSNKNSELNRVQFETRSTNLPRSPRG